MHTTFISMVLHRIDLLYGLSWSCESQRWRLSWMLVINFFPQSLQTNFSSPTCCRICRLKPSSCSYVFGHHWHLDKKECKKYIIFIITITQLEITKKCDLLSQPNSKWTRQDNYQMLFYDASCTIFLKPLIFWFPAQTLVFWWFDWWMCNCLDNRNGYKQAFEHRFSFSFANIVQQFSSSLACKWTCYYVCVILTRMVFSWPVYGCACVSLSRQH